MVILDILLYMIANLIWPEKPRFTNRGSSQEDCGHWIILDNLERDGKMNDMNSNDPFLNDDYEDGPDW